MIEALLGIDPALLDAGTLTLDAPGWMVALALLATLALVGLALGYRDLTPGARAAVAGLRAALVAVLVIALARPTLIVTESAGTAGTLGILIDGTRSMSLGDVAQGTRAEAALAALGPGSAASEKLSRRFDVRHLALAGSTVEPLGAPGPAAAHTDLAAGLDAARSILGTGAPAAIVLVSDGADSGRPERLDAALLSLRAAGIPVYAVGVGARAPARDLDVRIVALPRRALAGDLVESVVEVTHAGLAGREVSIRIEDEGAIVAEVPVRLPPDGDSVRTRVRLRLDEAGARRVRVSTAALDDEAVVANNEDVRSIEVSGDAARILHFEGEPRFEVKFLRRALAGDPRLEAVSLVRTAENKFYRLGVRGADELADGFPSRAEDLFVYDALVLGSVDAALLTPPQQALIGEFVARRGGGLVALGGRHALAEGGLGRADIAGMLPVVLGAPSEQFSAAAAMRPTPDGRAHPALDALAAGDWQRLPRLTIVNPIRAVKPGATVLLEADVDGAGSARGSALVGLAVQRYGRGLVAALPVRDTWRWQLHPDVALDDVTHEQFWRQLLRWATGPARERLSIETEPPTPGPGQPVRIRIEALDASYRARTGEPPTLEVEDPSGARRSLSVEADPGAPGVYHAALTPATTGRHDLLARIGTGDDGTGDDALESRSRVEVLPAGHELHRAGLDAVRLERIARETGGVYLPIDRADELATAIEAPPGAKQVTRRVPLGRAPGLLALMLALLGAEWVLRRRRRLA